MVREQGLILEHHQKIARLGELAISTKKRAEELVSRGETKPDFLELIQLLSEDIKDPEILQIITELLDTENDEKLTPALAAETAGLKLPEQETKRLY
ncbi:MAG: hypothetical protein AAB390_01635 [Patescibacteria group bacterium]